MALVNRINRAVNREKRYGATHPADTSDGVWDCENYAALKRDRLAAAGFPGRLTTYYCTTSRGERHAVLVATLPSGQAVVLDNMTPWALPREQTGHREWNQAYIPRQVV
jgi:predicted transglutaminase-like cysteine proteinase